MTFLYKAHKDASTQLPKRGEGKPLIVAPIGPAGVGKTTLINALEKRLSKEYRVRVFRPTRTTLRYLVFGMRELSVARDIWREFNRLFRPHFFKGVRDLNLAIQKLLINEATIRRAFRDYDIVVEDEYGGFHTILWMAMRATTEGKLPLSVIMNSAWFERSTPDLLVLCDLDEEERLRRRWKRANRTDLKVRYSAPLRCQISENYKKLWPRLGQLHKETGLESLPEVLSLDMARAIDENVDCMAARIDHLFV